VAQPCATPSRAIVRSDGRLNFPRLLAEFVEFWKEHGEVLEGGMSYHEVAPQLVLMGYQFVMKSARNDSISSPPSRRRTH
jgi:hypothetical protein